MSSFGSGRDWEKWEAQDTTENAWRDLENDTIDYDSVPRIIAEEEFADMLVNLKLKNVLSATTAGILAFWGMKAGATGPVERLALKPNAQSGKYSQKFDRFLNSAPRDLDSYDISVVRRLRGDCSRSCEPMATLPPHEMFAHELAACDDVVRELRDAAELDELPPFITDHPVMASAPIGEIQPFALYMDGVSFQRQDSVLGVWSYFLMSGRRHLLQVVRRSEVCNCGCKGWCTLHPLFSSLAWSLEAMKNGVWPSTRHDGTPFGAGDEKRAAKAGQPLGYRAVCVLLKGDWSEFHHTLGLPSWADSVAPCPWCVADKSVFFDCKSLAVGSTPHAWRTASHYEQACQSCEVNVRVGRRDQIRIRGALKFSKGGKYRGRVMRGDLPDLGLQAGDRLDPTDTMPDVASFDDMDVTEPKTVKFWRSSLDTCTRRRNPLFSEATGLYITCLGIDVLHALSLGVYSEFLKVFFWALIKRNAFGVRGGAADVRGLSIARIGSLLFQWYADEDKRGVHHPRVNQWLSTTLGSQKKPKLYAQGAATSELLFFALHLYAMYGHKLGADGAAYLQGVQSLATIQNLMKAHTRRFPEDAMAEFVKATCEHIQACERVGVKMKPKHHELIDLAGRLSGRERRRAVRASHIFNPWPTK